MEVVLQEARFVTKGVAVCSFLFWRLLCCLIFSAFPSCGGRF